MIIRALCISLITAPMAMADGSITYKGVINDHQPFFGNASLGLASAKLLTNHEIYWPAAMIRRTDSMNEKLALKAEVINWLDYLSSKKPSYSKVLTDIKAFKPFGRLPARVDPDAIRLRKTYNPLLAGDYTIQTSMRPDHFKVIGATNQAPIIMLDAHPATSELIDRSKILPIADPDYLYIISPDGNTEKTGYAYWNNRIREILPGSIVYIPIDENQLPDNSKSLNTMIVNLIASGEEQ